LRGIFEAISEGAFRELDIYGDDQEKLMDEIQLSGDGSSEWRVMAWVEMAEAASIAFSKAKQDWKIAAVSNIALRVAEGLAEVDSHAAAAAFVDDLRSACEAALSTQRAGQGSCGRAA
jgi:hypothetical protein